MGSHQSVEHLVDELIGGVHQLLHVFPSLAGCADPEVSILLSSIRSA
jgi:hypothetical protein